MKVNIATKRYWARTGPSTIFGFDYDHRNNMSDVEAVARWDYAWKEKLKPAVKAASKVPSAQALTMIPDDKRRNFFDTSQEHREFVLNGETLLVQINTAKNLLTQMWHLREKTKKAVPTRPEVKSAGCYQLAELAALAGIPEEEAAASMGAVFAAMLMGR